MPRLFSWPLHPYPVKHPPRYRLTTRAGKTRYRSTAAVGPVSGLPCMTPMQAVIPDNKCVHARNHTFGPRLHGHDAGARAQLFGISSIARPRTASACSIFLVCALGSYATYLHSWFSILELAIIRITKRAFAFSVMAR